MLYFSKHWAEDKGSDEPGSKTKNIQNERIERMVLKENSSDKRVTRFVLALLKLLILLRKSRLSFAPNMTRALKCPYFR